MKQKTKDTFRQLAEITSHHLGSPYSFFIAIFLIILWTISGFYLEFNQTWQLIINTGTTIATFLMVILMQNTQYRETRSMQLKLNELLYGTKNTRNSFLEIEDESDEELDELKMKFKELREEYIQKMEHRKHKKHH